MNDRIQVDYERWPVISSLLDQLLDLPQNSRAQWLESLGPKYAELLPTLRELLSHTGAGRSEFLNKLPALSLPEGTNGAPAPGDPLVAGALVGPYRLLRQLGRGGMAVVWLAEYADGSLKRPVALKLPLVSPDNTILAERFHRERDILAQLADPHIARLYTAGMTPSGQSYFVLEYVEGERITRYCDHQRLGLKPRLLLFLELLRAVQYAHERQIIHRDLKPSNVLVNRQGEVRLLDFGIAKLLTEGEAEETELTHLGGRILTPEYASPEQITGDAVGTASDVYSLGVILYELLTGESPYRRKGMPRHSLEAEILHADPAPPSQATQSEAKADARGATGKRLAAALRGDLDTIVLTALRKQSRQRYPTPAAFALDIERYLHQEPIQARPESAWYRMRKFVLRNRRAVGAAAAVAAAFGIGMAWNVQARFGARSRMSGIHSMAVLPLKPAGPERDEVLEIGISDGLSARLSRVRDLTVRSIDAVRSYSGPNQNPLLAGRTLRVDAVLAGTLQQQGSRLRIHLRLLATEDGRTLWDASFDQPRTGLPGVENAAAQRLAVLLSGEAPAGKAQVSAPTPANPEAFQSWMEGRYFFSQRTEPSIVKAIEKFELALARDPDYAAAHAALAETLLIYSGYRTMPQGEVIARVELHARKAFDLDPSMAEPYRVMALVAENYEYDRHKAEDNYKRALEIAPGNATTHHFYAELLGLMGSFEESEREFERAYALDPASLILQADWAKIAIMERKFDLAVERAQKALRIDPNFGVAREVLRWARRERGDSTALANRHGKPGSSSDIEFLARDGHRREALRLIAQVEEASKTHYVSNLSLARLYSAVGERDRAISLLEKVLETREASGMIGLEVDPVFDSLRSSPRFQALLAKLGATEPDVVRRAAKEKMLS